MVFSIIHRRYMCRIDKHCFGGYNQRLGSDKVSNIIGNLKITQLSSLTDKEQIQLLVDKYSKNGV